MRSLCPVLLTALLLAAIVSVSAQTGEDPYLQAMALCEEAKQRGDFLGMVAAIQAALKHGPGDEYAWRSLSWALRGAGRWQDSLAVAEASVLRNGESGWSLEELAEAQMAAGDFDGARTTLDAINDLPPDSLGTAAPAIEGTRKRLLDLTGQRRYRLHWKVDLGQEGPEHEPTRLLMPRWGDPRQTFEFTVSNVESYERVSLGPHDFIDVVQRPGEPFQIDATVTIRGFALGHAALDGATPFRAPEELEDCLAPFRHGSVFDPASPLCARIADVSRSTTMARTVQNILNWMRDNMVYADTANGELDAILAGGEGVCHHWCSSFTALCRAAGVPARVAHGVVLDGEGTFEGNAGSHGWASVYIDTLGWIPVEPLDATSLATFGRSNYLLTDYANEEPDDDHFAYTSIQGFTCDGEVLAIEP